MKTVAILAALVCAGAAHAHSCKDAEGRYWFQDEPCGAGMLEERFPAVPLSLVRDTPPPLGSELPPELAHYRVDLGWSRAPYAGRRWAAHRGHVVVVTPGWHRTWRGARRP
ncbi:MAG TPA: hypothetical protein PKJ45_12740 [Rubrivivax sp.]|nr:hypothetical protein [Rubrivivax sp.]